MCSLKGFVSPILPDKKNKINAALIIAEMPAVDPSQSTFQSTT